MLILCLLTETPTHEHKLPGAVFDICSTDMVMRWDKFSPHLCNTCQKSLSYCMFRLRKSNSTPRSWYYYHWQQVVMVLDTIIFITLTKIVMAVCANENLSNLYASQLTNWFNQKHQKFIKCATLVTCQSSSRYSICCNVVTPARYELKWNVSHCIF